MTVTATGCGTATRANSVGGQLASNVATELDRQAAAIQRRTATPCHDFNTAACEAAAVAPTSYIPRGPCVSVPRAADRWRCDFRTSDPAVAQHDAATGQYVVKLISPRCWIMVDVRATQLRNIQGCLPRGGVHQ